MDKDCLHCTNTRKIVIIGAGFVGSACAFSIMESGLFSEIVLIDSDYLRAEGEALDISHGIPFNKSMNIYAGNYQHRRIYNNRRLHPIWKERSGSNERLVGSGTACNDTGIIRQKETLLLSSLCYHFSFNGDHKGKDSISYTLPSDRISDIQQVQEETV